MSDKQIQEIDTEKNIERLKCNNAIKEIMFDTVDNSFLIRFQKTTDQPDYEKRINRIFKNIEILQNLVDKLK